MQSTARWVVTPSTFMPLLVHGLWFPIWCFCLTLACFGRQLASSSSFSSGGGPSKTSGEGATTSSASASLFRSRNQPTISGKLGWRNCQLRFLCLFWGSEGCCCVPLEKASWVQGTSDWPWARLVFLHWGAAPPCGVPHFLGGPHHRKIFKGVLGRRPGPRIPADRNRIEIGSKSDQNRIKIGSKSDQNRIRDLILIFRGFPVRTCLAPPKTLELRPCNLPSHSGRCGQRGWVYVGVCERGWSELVQENLRQQRRAGRKA